MPVTFLLLALTIQQIIIYQILNQCRQIRPLPALELDWSGIFRHLIIHFGGSQQHVIPSRAGIQAQIPVQQPVNLSQQSVAGFAAAVKRPAQGVEKGRQNAAAEAVFHPPGPRGE